MELQNWVLVIGVLTPLITLAGSALTYVRLETQKHKDSRYNRFWEVMKQTGVQDGNTVAKMAALYELRSYPEYAEVIIRLCEGINTAGPGPEAALLKQEMMLTAQFLRDTTERQKKDRDV